MAVIGPALAVTFCALAAGLALSAFWPYGLTNSLSMASASTAVVAMSLSMMLAARPRWVEPLFGGLDRMYRVHKWLGIAALGAMVAHDLLEPKFKRWTPETQLGDFAGDLGEFAFYGFIGLILVSWFKRIPGLGVEVPYQLWRLSH